jgi:uracil-DNA glycosylase
MRTIAELIEAVYAEATRAEFPIDESVYRGEQKDPFRPILSAGSLDAPVCVFGRDLGKDEVAIGEPLVGAGGRLVRSAVYEARFGEPPKKSNRRIEEALGDVLLTATRPIPKR